MGGRNILRGSVCLECLWHWQRNAHHVAVVADANPNPNSSPYGHADTSADSYTSPNGNTNAGTNGNTNPDGYSNPHANSDGGWTNTNPSSNRNPNSDADWLATSNGEKLGDKRLKSRNRNWSYLLERWRTSYLANNGDRPNSRAHFDYHEHIWASQQHMAIHPRVQLQRLA